MNSFESVNMMLDANFHSSMESYINDLSEMNATATEAFDGKAAAAKAMTAIKDFAVKAKARIVEMVRNIITRLGNFIQAMGNRMHTKEIAAPDEMLNAYRKIAGIMDEMTENIGSYVKSMTGYRVEMIRNGDDFMKDRKKETEDMRKRLEEAVAADVLKGRSVEDYITSTIEENGRTGFIKPSHEQNRISAMRAKWNGMDALLRTTAFNTILNTNMNAAGATDAERNTANYAKVFFTELYNAAAQRIVAATSVLMLMQKYVSGFIMIDKKFPPITSVYDASPAPNALPSHV